MYKILCKHINWMIIPAVLWMCIIFSFSARNAEASQEQSRSVGMIIGSLLISDFDKLPYEDQLEYAIRIEHPIRKLAHMSEYAILGLLMTLALNIKGKRRLLTAFMISVFYAITDEIHQLFVVGRSGQVSDVVIDSVGALAGCIIGILLMEHIFVRNNR